MNMSGGCNLLWSCALLFVAGCTVGPDRDASPPLVLPNMFATASTANGDITAWWRQFGDPVLEGLVAAALQHNRDLEAAAARVAAARAAAGIAAAGRWPQVGVGADRQWLHASRESAGLAGAGVRAGLVPREQDFHRIGADASWEIDLFGAVARRRERTAALAEASAAEWRGTALMVAADTASTWLELRFLQRRHAIAMAREQNLERQCRLARDARGAGLGDRIEMDALAAAAAAAASVPPQLAAAMDAAKFRLAVLVGRTAQEFELPASAGEPQLPVAAPVGTPAELLRGRPDLLAAEAEAQAAAAAVGIATADFYPRLFVFGGVGIEAQQFDRLFRTDAVQASGGPSLRLPVFQGGALRQALAVAEARHQEALATLAQRILAALADVESAMARHRHLRERLATATRAAESAATAAAAAAGLRRSGLGDRRAELRAAHEQLLAEDQRLLASSDCATSAVLAWKALGGGFGEGRDMVLP